MSYQDALNYLFRQLPMYQRQGPKAFKKDLNNIKRLAQQLGNPERQLKCIHIAGTNGKGTTAHLIAAMLQSNGFKVGLYTSPHYKDFRERIKINGTFISESSVIEFVEWFKNHDDIDASFFEITVAMAFDYFAKKEVDFAVIETGLGGRLDSTNIIDPLLSVITNISFDHTNFLGDTLPKIAAEKAGIIKRDRPVVIGRHQDSIHHVYQEKAVDQSSELYYAKDIIKYDEMDGQTMVCADGLCMAMPDNPLVDYPFFKENLRTALAAMSLLKIISDYDIDLGESLYSISDLHGLTYFIGRWMKLNERPLTIADSAHNQEGLTYVIEHLKKCEKKNMHFVLGFVNDKELSNILNLFPSDGIFYFAKADIPRGLNANELQLLAKEHELIGDIFTSVEEAFEAAKKVATIDDLIYIGGSIFTVAEIL